MLARLNIRDFVIVDRLELEFAAGFGALTGETGAGKSILVDALALALGERADALVVRQGAERADIAAEFALAPDHAVLAWLRANDFDADTCLLRRVVDAGGRSRAWINGTPATVGQLRDLGELLADIHGQHAHHSLLRVEAQRAMLDAHAGASALARQVTEVYAAWRAAREAVVAASRDAAASARERELLDWQVKELEALAFDPASWAETEQEQRRLGNAAALIDGASAALDAIDDGDAAVLPAVRQALSRLQGLADIDESLRESVGLLEGAAISLDESAIALRRYRDRLDLDPDRLAELDTRIDEVMQAARKHRVTPDELPDLLERLHGRLAELTEQGDPAALAAREAAAGKAFAAMAGELSALRRTAAVALAAAVTEGMQQLALAGGRFEIALNATGEGGSAHGLEDVEFLVSANAGQPPRPLAKVASGGELSRIGLALQVIASQATTAGTLIFDEVDVGIGGRVAEVVGRMLATLGSQRQVLCVTHLPQVAACANWQWSIAKSDVDGRATTAVQVLDADGRVGEIARMLGGERITETTRRHAAEMLRLR